MISLSEWISRYSWTDRPWLIIGKGPSFSQIHRVDLSQYHTVSLNHVVREVPVDVAHFIDLDAVKDSEDGIRRNAEWLLVPRFPHVDFRPADEPLEAWIDRVPILREFDNRDRLVCYSHIQRYKHGARLYPQLVEPGLHERYPLSTSEPLIPVSYFSGEAVVRILAAVGCRTVRTIGVDGGRSYSPRYSDLNTCLANGLPSFDWQFISIQQTAKETNMDYGPWQEPIRVYVETNSATRVPFEVLSYSIRRFASRPVEVIPIDRSMISERETSTGDLPDGVSLAPFLIPKLADYQGKAIFLRDGMLVLGDIAELADVLTPEQSLQCSREESDPRSLEDSESPAAGFPSVMVLDCGKLQWDIDEIRGKLRAGECGPSQMLFELANQAPGAVGFDIPEEWHHREAFQFQETRLLDYTDETNPPWRHREGSLAEIWHAFYRQALESGAVDPAEVEKGIAHGELSPELASDLDRAPARSSPVKAALAGTRSEQSRLQELERVSLAAHLDQLHVCYEDVKLHATQLEEKVRHLEPHCHAIEHQRQSLEQHCHAIAEERQRLEQHCHAIEHERQTFQQHSHALEQENHSLKQHCQALEHQHHALEERCQTLEQQLGTLEHSLQSLENHCRVLEQQNAAILNSYALRIGSVVTRPARAVCSLWRANSKDAA